MCFQCLRVWHGDTDCDDAPIKVNEELKPHVEIVRAANPEAADGEQEVEEEKKNKNKKKGSQKKAPVAVAAAAPARGARREAAAAEEVKAAVSFCPLCYSRNQGDKPPAANSRKK